MQKIVLSQSGLKDFMNCQRLFAWAHLEDLAPTGRRAALEIGAAVHEALAVLHSDDGTLEGALEAARGYLNRPAPVIVVDKTMPELHSVVENLLPAYLEYWSEKKSLWKPLGQEFKFLVEVGEGTDVYLRGRTDNLSLLQGGLYIVEYKTAAAMDPRALLTYELDMQLTCYIYAVGKGLRQEAERRGVEPVPIQGAIVDLLVKTKVPQFAREVFTRTIEELEEFEQEFVEYGYRIREQLHRVEQGENWKILFPKNTEQCFRFGTCPFRDLCLKDTPVRRQAFSPRGSSPVAPTEEEFTREQEALLQEHQE